MQSKIPHRALLGAVIAVPLMLALVVWGMSLNWVDAQATTPDDSTVVATVGAQEPDAQPTVTVTKPWGTVTATAFVHQTATANIVGTATTASGVTHGSGYVNLSWAAATGQDMADATYTVERQMVGMDPAATTSGFGWHVLDDGMTETTYQDRDVQAGVWYEYRVTPVEEGSTFEAATVRYFVRQMEYMFARGKGDAGVVAGVWVTNYADANTDGDDDPSTNPSKKIRLTLYDNEALDDGITVGSDAPVTSAYTSVELDGLIAGNTYWLKAHERNYNTRLKRYLPSTVARAAKEVVAGVVEQPDAVGALTITTDETTQKTTVSWTAGNDAEQVLAYHVTRHQTLPLDDSDPVVMGTTVSTQLTVDPAPDVARHTMVTTSGDTVGPYYEYSVMTINLDVDLVDRSVTTVVNPTPSPLMCANPDFEELRPIQHIALFHDITAEDEASRVPRTFDVMVYNDHGYPCVQLDKKDFYMERSIYYMNVIDEDECGTAEESCIVINRDRPNPRGFHARLPNTEIVQDTEPFVWGFWKWHAITFSDAYVAPGEYGMFYRVCMKGRNRCSYWRDTGIHHTLLADTVTAMSSFTLADIRDENLEDYDIRVLGDGLRIFQ